MVTDLYQRVVLEHNRAPRRFGRLEQPTHAAERANARCGDRLRCELQVREGRIEDLRFDGELQPGKENIIQITTLEKFKGATGRVSSALPR